MIFVGISMVLVIIIMIIMILEIIIMIIIMTLILISYITGERKQLQLCLATKAVERLSCQEGLDADGIHHQHHHR